MNVEDCIISEYYVHSNFLGIPMLVIIKKDGEIITSQGRNAIMQDPEGKVCISKVTLFCEADFCQ